MSFELAKTAKDAAVTAFEAGDYATAKKKIIVAKMHLNGIKRVSKSQNAGGDVELSPEMLDSLLADITKFERDELMTSSGGIQVSKVSYSRTTSDDEY